MMNKRNRRRVHAKELDLFGERANSVFQITYECLAMLMFSNH
jgi:hypothetical protein